MDHDLIRTALIILGGVLFYALLARGLFKATEPSRQKTLELAEKISHSAQVSDVRKSSIARRLGEVYSNWHAWQLALWMFSVVVILPFRSQEYLPSGVPNHLQKDFGRFTLNWMIATVGNSPAATLLFATLVLIALAFSASISAISSCLAADHDHHGGTHGAKAT